MTNPLEDPIAAALSDAANKIAVRIKDRQPCPACDAEAWSFPTDRALVVQWATIRNGQVVRTRDAHFALPFICANCGYVRIHLPLQSDLDDGSTG